jgi:N utilization substance protein B
VSDRDAPSSPSPSSPSPSSPSRSSPSRPDTPYTGGLGSRREARERAIGLLYEAETKGVTPAELLADLPVAPDEFATELVLGVGAHLAELDALITSYARDWKLERMPALDRAVLRLGTFELAYRPDIPTGAVISEAVELAKHYSTEDSGKFVNGMLSAIAEAVRG